VSELAKASATWMAEAVRARTVSALELVDACAARIERRNPEVNALVALRLEEARAEAARADAALARGEPVGVLHGVPFTVKEAIAVAGMPATNGSLLLAGRVAAHDAEVVRRMRAAGAILLGKTNLAELSAFWDSVNLVYGATRNPHDPTRSAGGSSGGEAAAVAAAMSPLGVGSDMSGSIRAPAHFTGVFGLRAGRDAIPFAAHDPLPLSAGMQMFAALGPLARSAADLDLMLMAAGERRLPPAPVVRVAVFEEDGLQPVSAACRRAVRLAADALSTAGISVVDDRPPHAPRLRRAFDTIFSAEFAVALRPLLSRREVEVTAYVAEQRDAFAALEPRLDDSVEAWREIALIDAEAQDWFARFAVALCPVAPDVAPPLGLFRFPPVDGERLRPGGKLTLCTYASALGLPAVAVPVTRSAEGLPVGVQLMARRGEERTLIALAGLLEDALGGWLDPDAAG